MKLSRIIKYIKPKEQLNLDNTIEYEVSGISYNTKTIQKGEIFVCIIGEKVDSHDFAVQAQEKGACAIVSTKTLPKISIPTLIVEDTKYEMARIASLLNEFPSSNLNLIGVTGTNGKTTVTHLIERIFEHNNEPCGLIGTLGQKMKSDDKYTDAKHTTPQAPELQSTLKNMSDQGLKNVVMEVSSHALDQYRVGGCDFSAAILTNLTQDHLDYHITMDNYFKAKSKLFEALKPGSYAVINNDDERADDFISIIPKDIRLITYGIKKQSDIVAQNIDFSAQGAKFECITPLGTFNIFLKMTGMFSVYNALAALCCAIGEKIDINTCINALEQTQGVAGRFEAVIKEPLVIVDYAHTPDGLENVLRAAKEILPEGSSLIGLFGCGGDRDATKRPQMAAIAEKLSDKIIITSDNPRSEDPQQIITDILSGIQSYDSDKIFVESSRQKAIELALKVANKNDIVVVAGKGHEDYQILKDKTIHFDDREEVLKAIKTMKNQF